MPFLKTDTIRLFYRLEGNEGLPVVVLSHSLGCDHGMWSLQMPELLKHFQVLCYDTRGHGASDAPAGDYSIEQLGRDVLRLTNALGLRKFSFCGLSMGGAVAEWLAIHAAERLTSLVLANTSPQFSAETLEARRKAVLENGIASIADSVMSRFFSPEKLAERDPYVQSVRSVLLGTDPHGYAGCCAALRDVNFRSLLSKISAPTLIIGGDGDMSTPWPQHGEVLAREIPHAKTVQLPTAHLSNVEQPQAFTLALLDFLPETA